MDENRELGRTEKNSVRDDPVDFSSLADCIAHSSNLARELARLITGRAEPASIIYLASVKITAHGASQHFELRVNPISLKKSVDLEVS